MNDVRCCKAVGRHKRITTANVPQTCKSRTLSTTKLKGKADIKSSGTFESELQRLKPLSRGRSVRKYGNIVIFLRPLFTSEK